MKAGDRLEREIGAVYKQAPCASGYDADRFGGRFGQYLERREIELYSKLLGSVTGDVLDAGTGTGKLSLQLLEQGCHVTGSDFSFEMLKIAKQKAQASGILGRFVVSDVRALCFRSDAFEHTLCSRVLMHVVDWQTAISELCRVTGETLLLDFPPRLSVSGLDSVLKRLLRRSEDHAHQTYRTFSPREVFGALRLRGFRVVESRRSFLLPIIVHRWLDRPSVSEKIEAIFARMGLTRLFGAPVTLKAVRVPE